MSNKIEISQEFFKKVLLEKLRLIDEKLSRADNAVYSNDELHDVWHDIRQSNLIVDEIIDALK